MSSFFSIVFYTPLYNAFVFLVDIMPGHSAALAVVALTIIIRLILFPLSRMAIKTQILMRQIDPEVKRLQSTIKDKQEQAQALMKLYKDNGINPFASFLLLLIQLPILIELYSVFRSGLPKINSATLYSFVHTPAYVAMTIVGINLIKGSIILALLAVITQFIQINLALPKVEKKKKEHGKPSSLQDDLAYNMNMQMRYIMPLVMFPIAYISAVVGLYITAGNIFTILQELFVRRRMQRQFDAKLKIK